MPNAHRLCQSAGIRLHGRKAMHPGVLPPKETWSGRTVFQIAKAHGDDHTLLVLETIVKHPHNTRQLYGETIQAVSQWVLATNLQPVDAPLIWDAFRLIDLGELRRRARSFTLTHVSIRMADRIAVILETRGQS